MPPPSALATGTITQTLYPPERFDYSPYTYSRSFSCPSTQGSFTVRVVNGDGNGHDTVSSAVVEVNGTKVVKSNDFNANTTQVSKPVTNLVSGSNAMTVQINTSSPGSYVTVTLEGIYTLDVKITSPAPGAQIIAGHTPVQGTYLSYSGTFNITVDNIAASSSAGTFNVSSIPLVSGSNLIRAVIATSDGLTDQDNVTVNGNLPPVAEAGPAQNVRTGESVSLDGRDSSDPEGAPIGYQWSLAAKPTGSQSVLAGAGTVGPSFVPDLEGAYVAQLIVNDGVQDSPPDNVSISAVHLNTTPTAAAGIDQNVNTGSQVFLDGTASFDPDADPIQYGWSITAKPQESLAALDNSASPMPSFVADSDGAYLLELVVNDGEANSAPDSVTIVAVPPNTPPTAYAGPDGIALRNRSAALDGSGSFDPEESALSYSWILVSRPEGSLATLDNGAALSPSFLPDLAGEYVFRLVVSDGVFDSAPDTVVVTAVNVPPIALATAASSDVPVNTTVSLDGSGSHDENYDPLSFAWSLAGRPAGSAASIFQPTSAIATLTPDLEGSYTIHLVVSDGFAVSASAAIVVFAFIPPVEVPDVVGMAQANAQDAIAGAGLVAGLVTTVNSDSVPSGNVISQSPSAWAMVPPGSAVNLTVSTGPLMVPVPVVLGMTQGEAQDALVSAQLSLGAVSNAYSNTVAAGRVISQDPPSGTTLLHHSAVSLVISQGEESVVIPPDPATVAPPLDNTVSSSVDAVSRFLYSGPDPIQTGVAPETIDPKRVTVLRGMVRDAAGDPLPGVSITVHRHPEFGATRSRADGAFDMAVNGGGPLTVSYSLGGHLSAHRLASPSWQEYVVLPDVVLIPYDNQVTTLDLSANIPFQHAQGSVTTDARGTRKATVLVSQSTSMNAVFPNGSTRPIQTASIRATEFTVGSDGEKRMPAPLPPASAYTYAVDLTVDEGQAAGASSVAFDRPVYVYVENFLEFPVGGIVPAGYYDREKAAWIPSANGKIIKILDIAGGIAVIDSDGDGEADDPSVLAVLGLADAEREKLATLYPIGASLWRVPVTHFTNWDFNWPYRLLGENYPENSPFPEGKDPCPTGPDASARLHEEKGSIILCESRVLGEILPISGTSRYLFYRSDRVSGAGQNNKIVIPLTDNVFLPSGLKRIEWEVTVGGRRFHGAVPPAIDCTIVFTWDGMGPYQQPLAGLQLGRVRVGYIYDAQYYVPPEIAQSFGISGTVPISGIPATIERALQREWRVTIGSWDSRSQGLGGWTLDVHHAYDPIGQTLFLGNGGLQNASDVNRVISTEIGGGSLGADLEEKPGKSVRLDYANGVSVDSDGSLVVLESMKSVVMRQNPEGMIKIIAGIPMDSGFSGDGGPAIAARLNNPSGVAIGPDGSIYIADSGNNRIRKIDSKDNTITTIAGDGVPDHGGDNGPATSAHLKYPYKVAPDKYGNVYIADSYNYSIRKIDSNGIITTVAGKRANCVPNSSRAIDACIGLPVGLATGVPESGVLLYVGSLEGIIWRVGTDGSISRTAGNGIRGFSGDGGPAIEASLDSSEGIALAPDGTLYIADTWNRRIRKVSSDGSIYTFAGSGDWGHGGDGGPALQAQIFYPTDVAIGPDGSIYLTDAYANSWGGDRIRRVTGPMPGFSDSDIALPSADGSEVYQFNKDGRHLRTIDSFTGAPRFEFGYESNGFIQSITDSYMNSIEIRRHIPFVDLPVDNVIAPGGQVTRLGIKEPSGYLESIQKPSGDRYLVGMNPSNGLLDNVVDWRGNLHKFEYDSDGFLKRDEDPAGGYKVLEFEKPLGIQHYHLGWELGAMAMSPVVAYAQPVVAASLEAGSISLENEPSFIEPYGQVEWGDWSSPPRMAATSAEQSTGVDSGGSSNQFLVLFRFEWVDCLAGV